MDEHDIVVTGSEGYLGSALIPVLKAKGYRICRIDTRTADNPCDAHEYSSFRWPETTRVIHLAWPRLESSLIDDNARAALTTARLARQLGTRMLFASSMSTQASELSAYAEGKLLAESAVRQAGGAILRFATLVGPSPAMRWDTLAHRFVRDAKAGRTVKVYGPSAWRPFLSIHAAIHRIVQWLERGPPPKLQLVPFTPMMAEWNVQKEQLARDVVELVPSATVELYDEITDPRDYQASRLMQPKCGLQFRDLLRSVVEAA